MNKQELIERIEGLKNIFGNKCEYVKIDFMIELVSELDEPKTGHADEAPRYVKNILARLRELPLHDREVWLKAIMGEFEKDFSHAKWREGYEQGKFEGAMIPYDEPEKVKIPQFVADWIEESRKTCKDVADFLNFDFTNEEVGKWFMQERPFDLVARAWLDGYEVEKEKRYKVVMPNVSSSGGVLTRIKHDDSWIWIDTLGTIVEGRTHTHKELEDADFGWVFDCPGIKIEEVKDE